MDEDRRKALIVGGVALVGAGVVMLASKPKGPAAPPGPAATPGAVTWRFGVPNQYTQFWRWTRIFAQYYSLDTYPHPGTGPTTADYSGGGRGGVPLDPNTNFTYAFQLGDVGNPQAPPGTVQPTIWSQGSPGPYTMYWRWTAAFAAAYGLNQSLHGGTSPGASDIPAGVNDLTNAYELGDVWRP